MSEETSPETNPKLGSEGQTFLVGPTIYLRGIEKADAKTTALWHPSPFPVPADVAEERIKKELDSSGRPDHRLIACRIADDRPVGSIRFNIDGWRTGWAHEIHTAPLLGEAGGAIRAEMVKLVVPWLQNERDMMVVWTETDGTDAHVAAAAAEIGMRRAYRLREARWHDGARRDEVLFEALHPAWVERLGAPPEPGEGPVEREVRAPASRAPVTLSGDSPDAAVAIGERVYLRPITAEDSEKVAYWNRRETETFFDNGRPIRSPLAFWEWHKKLAKEEPPEWVRFAIVLRETDEIIGSNGIAEINWIFRTAETESDIVRAEYRGSGYGTEAKHLLLTYAFEHLGLHMVRSYVWQPNTRSAAALRKQGYRDAGSLSWSGIKNGEFTGDFVFDLLASEWRAARR